MASSRTRKRPASPARLLCLLVVSGLLLFSGTRATTVAVLSDAFWQVSTYVAATLAIFFIICEQLQSTSGPIQGVLTRHPKAQVVFSALMGSLPGCGGAIVVITQYVKGRLSFGSVVAVLTSTMGDAAFLLWAAEPSTGLLVTVICAVVGVSYGILIDVTHGAGFMRRSASADQAADVPAGWSGSPATTTSHQGWFWRLIIAPALVVAVLGSMQVDADALLGLPPGSLHIAGAALAVVTMLLWTISAGEDEPASPSPQPLSAIFRRIAHDTNFVTCWVICSFLVFELAILWTGVELSDWFSEAPSMLIFISIAAGLLPGCGPQIMITSLYLGGGIPLSAQLGNAISNDGDALFPAIALAPKVAIVATIYTTIPAVLTAYGCHIFFE